MKVKHGEQDFVNFEGRCKKLISHNETFSIDVSVNGHTSLTKLRFSLLPSSCQKQQGNLKQGLLYTVDPVKPNQLAPHAAKLSSTAAHNSHLASCITYIYRI